MLFIWRGVGILVPIIYFLIAWIVSYWFDGTDTKIINPEFVAWTSLISGIIIFAIGLFTFNIHKKTGDFQAKTKVKRAHFFYIPILYWGVGILLLSITFFTFFSDDKKSEITEIVIEKPTTRILNLYNPGEDTLTYIIADETEDGLISREIVIPGNYLSIKLEAKSYLFSAFNQEFETTLLLPSKKYAKDTSKFVLLNDDNGKFYQRILRPATLEEDDYDEAWLVLDGIHNLILVEVTEFCDIDFDHRDIEDFVWLDYIYEIYDAQDLIEPLSNKTFRGKTIKVLAPGDSIPTELLENELVFMLIPYSGTDLDNEYIANWIKSL